MSPVEPWENGRDRGGGVSGDWRSAQPRFDDPMSWSLAIGHVSGVTVRVHAIFLLVVVVYLLKSLLSDPTAGAATPFDLPHTLVALSALFVIILLHEFGHVTACRAMGGDADEILIWPLGGLAWCDPPRRWSAEMITALGGPMVNVAIWIVGALLIGLTVGWTPSLLFPHPLTPSGFAQMPSRTLEVLYIVHWVNWVLLLLNMLPLFPLDGGQVLRAALARKLELTDATRVASRLGVIGSVVLAVVAIVLESWSIAAIAVFCAVTCLVSLRRIDFADAMEQGHEDPGSLAERRAMERRAERRAEREARRHSSAEQDRARLDEILAKIGREGRSSLSWSERRFLKRATRQLRDE